MAEVNIDVAKESTGQQILSAGAKETTSQEILSKLVSSVGDKKPVIASDNVVITGGSVGEINVSYAAGTNYGNYYYVKITPTFKATREGNIRIKFPNATVSATGSYLYVKLVKVIESEGSSLLTKPIGTVADYRASSGGTYTAAPSAFTSMKQVLYLNNKNITMTADSDAFTFSPSVNKGEFISFWFAVESGKNSTAYNHSAQANIGNFVVCYEETDEFLEI